MDLNMDLIDQKGPNVTNKISLKVFSRQPGAQDDIRDDWRGIRPVIEEDFAPECVCPDLESQKDNNLKSLLTHRNDL